MKLNTIQRGAASFTSLPPEGHDFVIIRPGTHLEISIEGFPVNDKRVISGGDEGVFDTLEDALFVMMNLRRLAVHDDRMPMHSHAVASGNRLVPETNPENGDFSLKMIDQIAAHPGLIRGAGSGREYEMIRLKSLGLLHRYLVIANNLHGNGRIEFSDALHEVVGEGIVIIDEQEHVAPYPSDDTSSWRNRDP